MQRLSYEVTSWIQSCSQKLTEEAPAYNEYNDERRTTYFRTVRSLGCSNGTVTLRKHVLWTLSTVSRDVYFTIQHSTVQESSHCSVRLHGITLKRTTLRSFATLINSPVNMAQHPRRLEPSGKNYKQNMPSSARTLPPYSLLYVPP